MELIEKLRTEGFKPMTESEINKCRLKAYLSSDEFDSLESFDGVYVYKNSKGNYVKCYILHKRNEKEVIVRNEFGVDVCLTINDLKKYE